MSDRSIELDADTYDRHDGATPADIYGPAEPRAVRPRFTPRQRRDALLTFSDPWADYLLPDGRCRSCGGTSRHVDTCPTVPGNPPSPALHATVGKRDEHGAVDIGLVVGQPMLAAGVHEVAIEWEHSVTLETVADLLTDIGACDHGAGAGRCGAPTAPGFEQCEQHGGADPLPVPR